MKSSSRILLVALATAAVFGCRKPAHDGREDPTRCATCHASEFAATKTPPHANARPETCGVCHTQTAWRGFRVDHPWYALTGAHARAANDPALAGTENQVKCFWCHRGDPTTWASTKTDCIACHESDRARSEVPGHDTFATTCQDCHSTESWKGATMPAIAVVDAGPPEPVDAGPIDAGVDAGPKKKPIKVVPHPPVVPTVKPPDITTGPSRRRHRADELTR